MSKIFGTREAKEIELLSGVDPASNATAPDAYVSSKAEYIGGFDKVAIQIRGTAVTGVDAGGTFLVQIADSATPTDDAWITYGRLTDMDGSTNQAKAEIIADIAKMLFLPANEYAPYIRVQGTFSVGGSYEATLVATA